MTRRGTLDRRNFVTAAVLGAGGVATAPAASAQIATAAPGTLAPRRLPGTSTTDGGVGLRIAAHVAAARYADIDADSIRDAKLRLIDVIGCAIGGLRGEGGAAAAAVIGGTGGGPASVLGTGQRAAPRDAAMANALLARTFDFEVMTVVVDGTQVPSHHAPTTVMSALAMAEAQRADGKTFLTAMLVGDDLAARTLAASGIDFNDGWDGVPLHATMASAAIAARLLKLDAAATRHALGMAVDQIGGTVQSIWDGASAWKVQQGNSARNGILAAEMASAGWSGMADPLLSPSGLYAQFTPGCARPELLTKNLGRDWHGEVYFKPWPSCAANHPAIECALALRAKNRIDPAVIDAIRVRVAPHVLKLFIAKPLQEGPSPHSQANFNIRFACATALLRGDLTLEDYEATRRLDPALASLIDRITLEPLPAGGKGVIVEVRTVDGRTITEALPGKPRGYPDVAGSTRAQIEAKFHKQVAYAGTVSATAATAILQRIDGIDREPDMAAFARLLADTLRFPETKA
ncbi:MmgE/PrpD family protein [Sphingomonas floccifaciens]|uniref:MmgE/PrpD family protein n=1 Tax=Sphingomonas floccifaciens TaxID=1844115 RepID=A0ABW4NDV3_9SPHN